MIPRTSISGQTGHRSSKLEALASASLCFLFLSVSASAQSGSTPPRKGNPTTGRTPTSVQKQKAATTPQPAPTTTNQAVFVVKTLVEQKRLTEALPAVDELLANPKFQRNAEAWYLKARVYAGLISEEKTRTLVPDGRRQALDAIRKSLEVDRNQALMLLTVEDHQTAYSLYTSGIRQGVDLYNIQRYEPALAVFRETAQVGEFIFTQGWGLARIDTSLTLNTGLAAYLAGRQEEAIPHFRKLADAEVGGGPEYASVYRYLAKYCYERKDAVNLSRYLSIGMKLFPGDEYLMLTDIEATRDSRDVKSLLEKYERFLVVFPNRYDAIMEYANELFGITHTPGNARTQPGYASQCARIEDLFNQSIRLRPDSDEAWLSLGKHFYNQALGCSEEATRYTGKSAEDRQLKSQLEQQASMLADKAIPPLEHVYTRLEGMAVRKEPESTFYLSACSLLSYCHEMRKDFPKSDFYRSKFETAKRQQ